MLIDKNARLFGKLNIIDLLLILVLIGAAAFGVMQLRSGRGLIGGESREFVATFFTQEIEDWAVTNIRVGDRVYDHIRGHFIGHVVAVEVGEAIVWNADQHGNTVRSNKPGFSSIELSVRVNGTTGDNTVLIAGTRVGVGMNYTLRAGGNAIFMRISALREA